MSEVFSFAMVIGIFAGAASAQMMGTRDDNPTVGGAAMFRTKDIVDNAVNSADHTTLVAAVKAAGLVETLKSKGPFTVGSSRVDLQACKLEYSIVSPK